MKEGFKGVYISRTCFLDIPCSCSNSCGEKFTRVEVTEHMMGAFNQLGVDKKENAKKKKKENGQSTNKYSNGHLFAGTSLRQPTILKISH